MGARSLPTPAFGEADLSNCEREQIQFAGSIQPHGAMLVVREPDHLVIQVSANSRAFLNLDREPLGRPLADVGGDLAARIRPHLDDPLHTMPMAVRCRVGKSATEFDCLLHRPPDGGLIVELEPAGPTVDLSQHVEAAINRIVAASSLRMLCDETARIFQALTGYDRVMVYRFDEEGHGEVFSEERKPELEAYLGNRYPASDIPQIARRLYERSRVRVLADVGFAPVPLLPRLSPLTGRDIDMSLCILRSHSPIHTQYLKNMGVDATLVVSLLAGGKLWGLIACHHYEPRFMHFEIRAVCELLAETIGTRIVALESFVQSQADLFVRRLEQRMIETIARDGDWRMALFDGSQYLLNPVGATGAALVFEGQILTAGEVPGTQDIKEIAAWLDRKPREPVNATASLGLDEPSFAAQASVASGCLATPISSAPGEHLIWFRPERIRTVTWGGNPTKPVVVGDDPSQLSPRRSFAQWHQLVEGTAEPWTPADVQSARLIGEAVADVVLQFRSVRTLIAQDQLEHVSRQVRLSDQPVIIADARGRILLTNDAFERLLPAAHPHLTMIEDLSQFLAGSIEMRRNMREFLANKRPWRGEVRLETGRGDAKPMLVRADPVFSSPERVLGFVLLFTDLTERKAAEAARRRFQEGIIDRPQVGALRLDSRADLVYQNVLSSVVENAQLAALEITYGGDTAHMPVMLESVRASVTRTSEVLEHLIWHATRLSDDDL